MSVQPSIEKFLDFFVSDDGVAYYQVKWAPTWERADCLQDFAGLMDKFWKFVNQCNDANIDRNASNIQKPPPSLPKPTPQNKIQMTPQKPLKTPAPRKQVTPKAPKQATPKTPKQVSSPYNSQVKNPFQNQQQIQYNMQQQITPVKQQASVAHNKGTTVIIDSDDEDTIAGKVFSQHPPASVDGGNTMQQFAPWDMNIKSEDGTMPQSPFNQQFPMQGLVGQGGGRPSTQPTTKRKLGMPSGASPSKQAFPIKQENNMGVGSLTQESDGSLTPADGISASDWKSYFETLENFVDGKLVSQSYKCKVCQSTIAQQSNCRRHFKKHTDDGSHEHECPICGKRFYRIDYIENHLKQHGHGSNDEIQRMIKLVSAGMKKK